MTTNDHEFSRLLSIEGIAVDKLRKESVEATEAECVALAKRFGIKSLSGVKASVNIRRVMGGDAIRVDGKLEADVVQSCVVSLRDVPSRIESEFETFFTEAPKKQRGEMELSFDSDEDSAEMIVNGQIDLGEVVAQYLSLELEPYPRAPGVSLAAQMAEIGDDTKNRPFAVLKGKLEEEK